MFRANVARQLIGNFTSRIRRDRVRQEMRAPEAAPVNVQAAVHQLERNPAGKRICIMCRNGGRLTGRNPRRPHESSFWCSACRIAVCHPRFRPECWAEHNV